MRRLLLSLLFAVAACKGHGKGDGSGGGHGGGGGKKSGSASAKVDDSAKTTQGGKGGGNGEGGGGENEGDAPRPTADLKITITGPDGEKTFTGDKLDDLSTSTAPVGDTSTPGWTLLQVLDAVGVKPTGNVVVYGAEDANLILEPTDFDPAKAILFIKLNRSGQLRFRVFRKAGSTWELGGELRGIDKIELK